MIGQRTIISIPPSPTTAITAAIWISELRGDRGRDAKAHARETVGHKKGTWLVTAPELPHEQFMRADITRDDAVSR